MAGDAWLTLAVVIVTLVVLVRDILPPSAAILTAVVALLVTDVVTPAEAFSGFSNPAPITVAALYVLAGAVEKTGLLEPLVGVVVGGGRDGRRSVLRLVGPAAAASTVLNNTPIVAMLMSLVRRWSNQTGRPASRLLMPLSFAAILGGLVTAIGTSTNLVVSGLLVESGRSELDLFEMVPLGLPIAVVGVVLIVVLAPVLLRDRSGPQDTLTGDAREFLIEMAVASGGSLDGTTIADGGLRHLQGVFLVEIERDGEVIAPVAPTAVLRGGDRLRFVGQATKVLDLQHIRGLEAGERHHLRDLEGGDHQWYEAVIGSESTLVGRTLQETGFRGRYQAAVMAIHRAGQRIDAKLGEVRLRPGDTLLLLGGTDFRGRWGDRRDFLAVAPLGGPAPARDRKAPLAAVIGVAVVVAAATGALTILEASLLGALALVATGVLTADEARQAVDIDVVVVIAAAFGLGAAVQVSGLADRVAELLVDAFGGLGDVGVLLGVVLACVALTELITNNAAAVLMFPIALDAGASTSIDPRGMAIAVAVAASASFLTPIGYQTNTMVYGPGGYRFSDYARLGAPLTVAVVAGICLIVPVVWG